MKKKPASRSAFFNPRVLIGFAFCAIGLCLALIAFALYPGGNAFARDNQSSARQVARLKIAVPNSSVTAAMADVEEATAKEDPAQPDVVSAVFLVNTTADTLDVAPGDGACLDVGGLCSLRAAISEANALAGTDTITLPAGTYTASLVAANEDLNAGGDFDIRSSLTINGAGSGTTIIQANAAAATATERVMHVAGVASTTVDINNVTIRHGNATGVTSGGGMSVAVLSTVTLTNVILTNNRGLFVANNFFGGGLIVSGVGATATLTGCTVSNNSAIGGSAATNGFAGGIYNQQATVNIINSTVSGNTASSFHAGVRTLASTTGAATTNITNSTISGNSALGVNGGVNVGQGGGVTNISGSTFACTTNITSSTVSGNSAVGGVNSVGGGLMNFNGATATGLSIINVTNSTVSGNSADVTGGGYNDGAVSRTNYSYSTVAGNTGTTENGGILQDVTVGGLTNLMSSIVADNTSPIGPDIDGTITSQFFNHIESTAGGVFVAGAGDITGADPLLGVLAANGGPTNTHLPGGASTVINAISSGTNGCQTSIVVDQRGVTRPAGSGCDKGSVEQGTGPTPTPPPSGTPTPTPAPTATPTPTGTPTATPTAPPTVCAFTEGFVSVAALPPLGWVQDNNSTVIGSTGWFQGSTATFPAHQGPANSYIAANFNSDGGPATDTISNWLLTPPITLQTGGTLSFWTRTVNVPQFPDRLQVRMSTNLASINVGTLPTDVGDFTTLLLDINPTYTLSGYPNVWTNFVVVLPPMTMTKGRLAFRYFVENGGPAGVNSDFIGIDLAEYGCSGFVTPTPTPIPPTPTPTPTPAPTGTPFASCPPVITHSSSQTVVAGSVSCNTAGIHGDNSYWRAFDMNIFAGLNQYNVTSVSFGIESANDGGGVGQPVTVRLYAQTSGVFPGGTRALLLGGSTTATVLDATLTVLTVPLVTVVPAGTTELIMEVNSPDGAPGNHSFFIGSNALPETGPSYLNAASCGIPNPVTVASIGFPNMHIIMNVNGACAAPTPTPTPSFVSIAGTVTYCTNPALPPISSVTMSLTGAPPAPTSTLTDVSGNYTLGSLSPGSSYTVTPTKAAKTPGTSGINTSDSIAIQRHFLGLGTPLTGCRLLAADTNDPINGVSTTDAIAAQRFFLGLSTGIAQTGRYKFSPVSTAYAPILANQTSQNYNAVILGDAATAFVAPRPGGPEPDAAIENEIASTVSSVTIERSSVNTSAIDAKSNLVGFQADFTFDERVVTLASLPVSNAGLTANNWSVSGNVLDGPGPIRTLRVSAFSLDGAPLSGTGVLFNVNVVGVDKAAQGAPLAWASAGEPFVFIDADLKTQRPSHGASAR